MFKTAITDPNGAHWTVTLRLIPHRQGVGFGERFFRRRSAKKNDPKKTHWYDFIDIPILDGIDELWLILAIIVALAVFVFIGWPLLLLLSDFIWLVVVSLGGLISYGVLGRPVTITADNGSETHSWKVRGLIRAIKYKEELIENLGRGIMPAA